MDDVTRLLATEQLEDLTSAIERGERWFTVKRIESMLAVKQLLEQALGSAT